MLHDTGKNQCRHKRNRERISHCIVVLLEGVFEDVQIQCVVQVFKENLTHVVAFG